VTVLRTAKTKTKDVLRGAVSASTEELHYLTRMSAAFAKGALARAARSFVDSDTTTWEFSVYSQNGEDGIVEELLRRVKRPNRYFIEVGASDGLENNVSYLAYGKKYCGLMVEGDPILSAKARRNLQAHNWGVDFVSMMAEPDTASALVARCLEKTPDFFSLDIDGNDYHVVKAILEAGLKPRVVCLEYNSAFGPEEAVTIPYERGFVYQTAHPSQLYYGVSIAAWRHLLSRFGYAFVTVETNGVNAFFIDPEEVQLRVNDLRRLEFAENFAQRQRFRSDWTLQRRQLDGTRLVSVETT
jgi:hypothetical protein